MRAWTGSPGRPGRSLDGALKVRLAAEYAAAAGALAPPAASPQEHTAREMALSPRSPAC